MDKKEFVNALKTIKDVCKTTSCRDCPLGFKMLIANEEYYKCVLMYYKPCELQIVDYDDVWRATYQSKILEEKYGKADKGAGC